LFEDYNGKVIEVGLVAKKAPPATEGLKVKVALRLWRLVEY
jgi:hypothetical protein